MEPTSWLTPIRAAIGLDAQPRARELELALRCNVDPDLVLGFLYEVGPQEVVLRKAGKTDEPLASKRYRAR